jgi:glucose dehydrogenase
MQKSRGSIAKSSSRDGVRLLTERRITLKTRLVPSTSTLVVIAVGVVVLLVAALDCSAAATPKDVRGREDDDDERTAVAAPATAPHHDNHQGRQKKSFGMGASGFHGDTFNNG